MDSGIADATFALLATPLSNFIHHSFNISASIDEFEFYILVIIHDVANLVGSNILLFTPFATYFRPVRQVCRNIVFVSLQPEMKS